MNDWYQRGLDNAWQQVNAGERCPVCGAPSAWVGVWTFVKADGKRRYIFYPRCEAPHSTEEIETVFAEAREAPIEREAKENFTH